MKVLKYGTGQVVPDNAEYLTTVVEEKRYPRIIGTDEEVVVERYVWHYFLVRDGFK